MTLVVRWTIVPLFALASAAGGQVAKSPAKAASKAAPKRASLAGVVHDSLGAAIPRANVFVDGSTVSAISDDSGHFYLRGLAPGKNGFTVTKIGFTPVSFETT